MLGGKQKKNIAKINVLSSLISLTSDTPASSHHSGLIYSLSHTGDNKIFNIVGYKNMGKLKMKCQVIFAIITLEILFQYDEGNVIHVYCMVLSSICSCGYRCVLSLRCFFLELSLLSLTALCLEATFSLSNKAL